MITPDDIVFHLQAYLPAFTSDFSNQISGSASVSGGVVTFNAPSHGMRQGRMFVSRGSRFQNALTDVTINNDGSTRFTVGFDHDLTAPKLPNDPTTLTIEGVGAPWDGVHTIDSIPNRRTFEIATPSGQTVEPDISNGFLIEQRSAGLSGLQEVATVVDTNNFTVSVPTNAPALPDGEISDITILKSVRVEGAADIERAIEIYTQHEKGTNEPKPYLFVIMLDADVSKDRHSLNDGILTATTQNEMKQTVLQNFAVACFIPTASDDRSGFKAINSAYKDYYTALINTLYGFGFNQPESQQNYVTVSNGHGPGGNFNSSYYLHVYNWQAPATITFDNGFNLQPDVAFRDIMHTWDIRSDDMAQMSANINLDEEPL